MAKCKLIRSSIPAKITYENEHDAWTNPNPSATFAGQEITLDTSDFDGIEVQGNAGVGRWFKGSAQGILAIVSQYNSRMINDIRPFTVSGNKVTFFSGYRIQQTSAGAQVTVAENNGVAVPLKIYTFKLNPTIDVTAIASSVKTNAQNCMMSDGTTSVEDAINASPTTSSPTQLGNITLWTATDNGILQAITNNNTANAYVYIIDDTSGLALASSVGYNANVGSFCSTHVYKGRRYRIGTNSGSTLTVQFLPMVTS